MRQINDLDHAFLVSLEKMSWHYVNIIIALFTLPIPKKNNLSTNHS